MSGPTYGCKACEFTGVLRGHVCTCVPGGWRFRLDFMREKGLAPSAEEAHEAAMAATLERYGR